MSELFDPSSSEYSVNHGIALYRSKVLDELNAKYIDHNPDTWKAIPIEHMKLNNLYIQQFEKILGASSREQSESIRRSFYFAYELGEDIAGGVDHYDFGTYLVQMSQQSYEGQRQQLLDDVADYVDVNPEVEGVVACYSDYLSEQDDTRIPLCETVAGATFMMIDQSLRERFIDKQRSTLDKELEILLDTYTDDDSN